MYGKDFGMDGLPSADDVFRKMGFSSKGMAKAAQDEALSRLNSIKLSPEEAFFSDTISHSTYYKYLNVLRERKISFGYIHGVNIENNIRHIYNEMKE